ncbi:MAG: alanine dehydrogenase, partial [Methylophilaceae bacterium]
TYMVDGVIHYCVANMPGSVPNTSAYALNNATLPFISALADKRLQALKEDSHLMNGLTVYKGMITNEPVASALGYDYVAPEIALAS